MAKKKHVRKKPKKYDMVTFESSLFEGEFTLPNVAKHMNPEAAQKLAAMDISGIVDILRSAGADEADIEVFCTLDNEDAAIFVEEWAKASQVSLPKS